MWIYTNKDGTKVAISYSNIDYVILSRGYQAFSAQSFYHRDIKEHCSSEFITIIYKKSGGFIYIESEEAFNYLTATLEHKFVCDKD